MKTKIGLVFIYFIFNCSLRAQQPSDDFDSWFIVSIYNDTQDFFAIEDCDYLRDRIKPVVLSPQKKVHFYIEDAHMVEFITPSYLYFIGIRTDTTGFWQKATREKIPSVISLNHFPFSSNGQLLKFILTSEEELRLTQ